MKQKIKL